MKCLRWNGIPASGRESSSLSIPFGKALTEVLGPSSWRDSAVSQARISSDGGGLSSLKGEESQRFCVLAPTSLAGLLASKGAKPPPLGPRPPSQSQGSELTQRECSPVGVSKRRVRRGGAAGRGLCCPGHCLDRGQRREASAGPQTLTCRVPGI